jgi:hypothetical protein
MKDKCVALIARNKWTMAALSFGLFVASGGAGKKWG